MPTLRFRPFANAVSCCLVMGSESVQKLASQRPSCSKAQTWNSVLGTAHRGLGSRRPRVHGSPYDGKTTIGLWFTSCQHNSDISIIRMEHPHERCGVVKPQAATHHPAAPSDGDLVQAKSEVAKETLRHSLRSGNPANTAKPGGTAPCDDQAEESSSRTAVRSDSVTLLEMTTRPTATGRIQRGTSPKTFLS